MTSNRYSSPAGFMIALSQGVAAIPRLIDTLQAVSSELTVVSNTPPAGFDVHVVIASESLPPLPGWSGTRIVVANIDESTVRWGGRVGADAVISPEISVKDVNTVLAAATGGYYPVPRDLAPALSTRLEDPNPPMLSERDRTILTHLAAGATMNDLARELGYSERHARRQVRSLWDSMDVRNRAQGLVAAARRSYLETPNQKPTP